MMYTTVTIEKQIKNGSKWITTETETKDVDSKFYTNYTEARGFFTGLGGTERHYRQWTGGPVYKVVSTSPNRTDRSIATFK